MSYTNLSNIINKKVKSKAGIIIKRARLKHLSSCENYCEDSQSEIVSTMHSPINVNHKIRGSSPVR